MLADPNSIIGLGDAGAHLRGLCDASSIPFMITHWTRDRRRGELFPIGWAVKRLTRDTAAAMGLNDRGVLAPGYKADINVIDHAALSIRRPEVLYDLPGGAGRLVQRADGIVATIVSGVPVYRNGEETGELPGRVVRGMQAAPKN